MTLIKTRPEMSWPAWLGGNPLVDWTHWPTFTGDAEIKVEEFTEDGNLVVRAEIPGIDPDQDVEITVADHVLSICAERRREEKTEGKDGFRSEFSYGSYRRTMRLPTGATETDIKATYHDGILEVRVPVAEAIEARKVTVARS
jgi:HSP20 family protein